MARPRKPNPSPGGADQSNRAGPVTDIPAQRHGQAKALREIQQATPAPGGPAPGPGGGGAQGGVPAPVVGPSIFRPTERPNEAGTAGIPFGPGDNGGFSMFPTDSVDDFIRALHGVLPSPALARLLRE